MQCKRASTTATTIERNRERHVAAFSNCVDIAVDRECHQIIVSDRNRSILCQHLSVDWIACRVTSRAGDVDHLQVYRLIPFDQTVINRGEGEWNDKPARRKHCGAIQSVCTVNKAKVITNYSCAGSGILNSKGDSRTRCDRR